MIPFISHSFPIHFHSFLFISIHFIFYHLFSFLFPKSLKGSFSSDPFFGAANILLPLARPRRPRTTGPRRPRRPCNGGFGGLAPHGKEIMQITRDACCGQITYVPGALTDQPMDAGLATCHLARDSAARAPPPVLLQSLTSSRTTCCMLSVSWFRARTCCRLRSRAGGCVTPASSAPRVNVSKAALCG